MLPRAPLGGYADGGYAVQRYPAGGGSAVAAERRLRRRRSPAAPPRSRCLEAACRRAAWRYTVTPVLGSWTGAESAEERDGARRAARPSLPRRTRRTPGAGQATGAIALSWSAVAGADRLQRLPPHGAAARTTSRRRSTAPRPSPSRATPTRAPAWPAARPTPTSSARSRRERRARAATSVSATAIARLGPAGERHRDADPRRARSAWAGRASPGVAATTSTAASRPGTYDYSTPAERRDAASTGRRSRTRPRSTARPTATWSASVVTGAGGAQVESLQTARRATPRPAGRRGAEPASSIADPGSPLRGTSRSPARRPTPARASPRCAFQVAPAGSSTWTNALHGHNAPLRVQLRHGAVGRRPLRPARGRHRRRRQHDGVDASSPTAASTTPAPSVTVNDPARCVRGTVTLSATASDAGSGRRVAWRSSARRRAPRRGRRLHRRDGALLCSLNTTTLADGGYDLRAIATDVAGNATTSAVLANRVIDNTAPTGIDHPDDQRAAAPRRSPRPATPSPTPSPRR